ncbi:MULTISPECIES: hypothetical protein [unclassified Nocardioides]|uniref:TRAFAC clade GTPase domain-containing protein n=1 Tax=unclassified Nocardioides TaxID=2615069 RepID=UPI00301521F2
MTESPDPDAVSALFVGLPYTGKTTYLALAYGTIVNDLNCGVDLDAHDDDRAYLNRILGALQEFRQADHTTVGETEGMNLSLRFSEHASARVEIPDLSGETWQSVHVDRSWDRQLVDAVHGCTGFVLFTNVDYHEAGQTVAEHQADAEALGDEDWDPTQPHSEEIGEGPTQLALVDLLQALRRVHDGVFRLSIVLSAFDAALPADIKPTAWVEQNLPLLAQYVAVNADRIESRAFGVSGQGGVYPPPPDLESIPLLRRAFVRGPEGENESLLAPLLWALGHDHED